MKKIVFFSAKLDQPSVHPSWYHLEDRIKPEQWDLAPKIRVVILGGDKETILIDDMSLLLSNLRQLPEDNDDQLVSWGQPHHPPKALHIPPVAACSVDLPSLTRHIAGSSSWSFGCRTYIDAVCQTGTIRKPYDHRLSTRLGRHRPALSA